MNQPIHIICRIEGGIPTFYASRTDGVNITVLDEDVRDTGELDETECERIERMIDSGGFTEVAHSEPDRAEDTISDDERSNGPRR